MTMCLVIGALVTLERFGFPRSIRVGFVTLLVLIVGFVDLMRGCVESFATRREV